MGKLLLLLVAYAALQVIAAGVGSPPAQAPSSARSSSPSVAIGRRGG